MDGNIREKAEVAALRQELQKLRNELNAMDASLRSAWRVILSLPSRVVFEQAQQKLAELEKAMLRQKEPIKPSSTEKTPPRHPSVL